MDRHLQACLLRAAALDSRGHSLFGCPTLPRSTFPERGYQICNTLCKGLSTQSPTACNSLWSGASSLKVRCSLCNMPRASSMTLYIVVDEASCIHRPSVLHCIHIQRMMCTDTKTHICILARSTAGASDTHMYPCTFAKPFAKVIECVAALWL